MRVGRTVKLRIFCDTTLIVAIVLTVGVVIHPDAFTDLVYHLIIAARARSIPDLIVLIILICLVPHLLVGWTVACMFAISFFLVSLRSLVMISFTAAE